MEVPKTIRIPKFNVEYISVKLLKPYDKNTKLHSKEQIDKIAKSIETFGFRFPVLINNLNEKLIIAGHGRKLAAEQLGMSEIPVVTAEDLTPEQIRLLRIADNKVTESEWDFNLLKLEFEDFEKLGLDLDLTGFGFDEIAGIMQDGREEAKEDDFDTEQALKEPKYKIERGEVWQLGEHRLMCGDSTIKEDVNNLIEKNKIDLILTDPPYGIGIVKSNGKIGFGDGRLGFNNSNKSNIGTMPPPPIEPNRAFVPIGIHKEIIGDDKPFNPEPLLIYGKNQIIFGGNYFCNKLPESSCWIIWDKRIDIPSNNFADCEIAWTSFERPSRIFRHLWSGLIREGERNEEMIKRVHPTQKPVGLFKQILNEYSKENEIIMDLYGGSGSTLIACEQLNHKCYMMEIDPVYCSVIIERWEALTNKKAVKC